MYSSHSVWASYMRPIASELRPSAWGYAPIASSNRFRCAPCFRSMSGSRTRISFGRPRIPTCRRHSAWSRGKASALISNDTGVPPSCCRPVLRNWGDVEENQLHRPLLHWFGGQVEAYSFFFFWFTEKRLTGESLYVSPRPLPFSKIGSQIDHPLEVREHQIVSISLTCPR